METSVIGVGHIATVWLHQQGDLLPFATTHTANGSNRGAHLIIAQSTVDTDEYMLILLYLSTYSQILSADNLSCTDTTLTRLRR
jgi:hypothetical protein